MAPKRPQKKHLFTVEKPKQEGSVALFDLSWELMHQETHFSLLCTYLGMSVEIPCVCRGLKSM